MHHLSWACSNRKAESEGCQQSDSALGNGEVDRRQMLRLPTTPSSSTNCARLAMSARTSPPTPAFHPERAPIAGPSASHELPCRPRPKVRRNRFLLTPDSSSSSSSAARAACCVVLTCRVSDPQQQALARMHARSELRTNPLAVPALRANRDYAALEVVDVDACCASASPRWPFSRGASAAADASPSHFDCGVCNWKGGTACCADH